MVEGSVALLSSFFGTYAAVSQSFEVKKEELFGLAPVLHCANVN